MNLENMQEQEMHDRPFTSDAIGMLILNELKCFRAEITKEVKTLTQVLQKVMETQSTFPTPDVAEDKEGSGTEHESGLWKTSHCFNVTNQCKQLSIIPKNEGFREILPGSRDDILNNHIAFRMSSTYGSSNNETRGNDEYLRNSPSENEGCLSLRNQTHPVFLPAVQKSSPDAETTLPIPIPIPINMSQAEERSSVVKKKQVKYSVLYKCNICPDKFASQSLYNQHFYDVHSDVETANSTAPNSLWDDQTLFTAVDYQQPKIIYVCGICSRQFSAKGSLLRHNILHSGVRKFVCKICGKAFFRSDHLKSHLPTHTRQKSFSCRICDKYFLRQQTLFKHMKIHEDELDNNTACYEGYGLPEEISSRTSEEKLMKANENDAHNENKL